MSGTGNFSDTDSEVDIVPRLLGNNSLWLNGLNDSDTDSDDEDFRAGDGPGNEDNDTDSLTGITKSLNSYQIDPIDNPFISFSDSSDSESSQSSSDSSSDSDDSD